MARWMTKRGCERLREAARGCERLREVARGMTTRGEEEGARYSVGQGVFLLQVFSNGIEH
jgi:hypothetical protein